MDVTGTVRRDDDDRRLLGPERAQLRDRDRVVGEDLEQEGFELVVGAVELVDQENGGRGPGDRPGDRLQQRAPHEEALGVELVLDVRPGRPACLRRAQVQQLAGVVPFVDGLRDVDAVVALQAQQLAARPAGQHLGDLRLADAGLALQEQGSLKLQRQEHDRRQTVVGEILVRGERPGYVVRSAGYGPSSAQAPTSSRARRTSTRARCLRNSLDGVQVRRRLGALAGEGGRVGRRGASGDRSLDRCGTERHRSPCSRGRWTSTRCGRRPRRRSPSPARAG